MAKFVLQLLLPEQKEHRATVTNDLTQTTANEPDFLKVTTLKGPEVSVSYIQCFLYLVSSSIYVSIFHSTRMDTFWTDLVYILCTHIQRARM